MHFWQKLGEQYANIEPTRIAEAVVEVFESPEILLDEGDPPMKALATATDSNRQDVLNTIGNALLPFDSRAHRLQLALKGWFVSRISSDLLIDWAKKHPPNGAKTLARLTEPTGVPLNELTRKILDEFGEDDQIGNIIKANFHSGTFQGKMTEWLGSKLELARNWTRDPSTRVSAWAAKLVESLELEIKEWKTREEEEELVF